MKKTSDIQKNGLRNLSNIIKSKFIKLYKLFHFLNFFRMKIAFYTNFARLFRAQFAFVPACARRGNIEEKGKKNYLVF